MARNLTGGLPGSRLSSLTFLSSLQDLFSSGATQGFFDDQLTRRTNSQTHHTPNNQHMKQPHSRHQPLSSGQQHTVVTNQNSRLGASPSTSTSQTPATPTHKAKKRHQSNTNGVPEKSSSGVEVESTTQDPLPNGVEETKTRRPNKKGMVVKFPEDDQLVTGFAPLKIPHFKRDFVDPAAIVPINPHEIISAYRDHCDKVKLAPSSKVELQIGYFHGVPNVRQEMFSVKGERINHQQLDCLEEIFRRVQFDLLDFEYSFLDDEATVALSDILEFYDSALNLNLSFNQHIGIRGWQALFKTMKNSRCLESLNLRYTSLNERSVPLLARSLRLTTTLAVLHLENCSLSGKSMLLLVCALKANRSVKELYLGENNLGPQDGAHLHQLCAGNTTINMLDLRNNQLQDVGLKHICDALSVRDTYTLGNLTTLVLWNNRITVKGMDALRIMLKENKRLETLNLGCNAIGSEGVLMIQDSLTRNKTLLRLGLQATKLNDTSAITLAECLAENPVLARVDLRDNGEIRTAGLLALHLALKMNRSITCFNLDSSCCNGPSAKMKEYGEQFRRYYDELQEFCERNRLDAERRKMHELIGRKSEEADSAVAADDLVLPNVPEDDDDSPLVVEAAEEMDADEQPPTTKPTRTVSLTCVESVDDVRLRLDRMRTEQLAKAHAITSDNDAAPARFTISTSPLPSPSAASDVGRFNVAVSTPPSAADQSMRRPTALSLDDTEAVVKGVVADLVNFCVYELGDYAYTPSVPQRSRCVLRALAIGRSDEAEACSSSAHQHETDEEVEVQVRKTVRDLLKQCILMERDTLKRVKRKHRTALPAHFTADMP